MGHQLLKTLVRGVRHAGGWRRFHPPFDALELDHDALVGLTRLWSRIHWSPGDGMMPADQLLAVYRLAATWPVPGDVVELGAWVGLTTSYLAGACRVRNQGKVYAVDTFTGVKEGNTTYPSVARYGGDTRRAFEERIQQAGVTDIVEPLVGLTTDVADIYPGRPIRLLLIDADHSYDGVRRDFECWSPHVAPGGLIIFHDYLMPQIARFVDGVVKHEPGYAVAPGHVVPNVFAVTKRGRDSRTACRATRADRVEPGGADAPAKVHTAEAPA